LYVALQNPNFNSYEGKNHFLKINIFNVLMIKG
jgi:hypothetical protein